MRSCAPWLALSAAGLAMLHPAHALAEDAGVSVPSMADRKEAARKFAEGTRAFDLGDYTRAGEAFEAAYSLLPHEDPLLNAAHAWHRAGELARAANLYVRYLRMAPANATDRPGATAALARLGGKLARLELHTTEGVDDIRVDGVAVDGPVIYVVPGAHAVRAHSSRGDILQRAVVAAGVEVSVLLSPSTLMPPSPSVVPEPQPAAAPVAPDPARERPPLVTSSGHTGWPPVVVFAELGVTVATAAVMVWSGVDTENALGTFRATPTQATLDSGRSDEVRTNVLIGATVGLAALTGVTAIWLTSWHTKQANLALGFGSATLRGSF